MFPVAPAVSVSFNMPRSSPTSTISEQRSFSPSNDLATYRDLLLFEERLKTNAANLRRRKSRYQCNEKSYLYDFYSPSSSIQYSLHNFHSSLSYYFPMCFCIPRFSSCPSTLCSNDPSQDMSLLYPILTSRQHFS